MKYLILLFTIVWLASCSGNTNPPATPITPDYNIFRCDTTTFRIIQNWLQIREEYVPPWKFRPSRSELDASWNTVMEHRSEVLTCLKNYLFEKGNSLTDGLTKTGKRSYYLPDNLLTMYMIESMIADDPYLFKGSDCPGISVDERYILVYDTTQFQEFCDLFPTETLPADTFGADYESIARYYENAIDTKNLVESPLNATKYKWLTPYETCCKMRKIREDLAKMVEEMKRKK